LRNPPTFDGLRYVYIYVGNTTAAEEFHLRRLRAAYEDAFLQLSSQVRQWQTLVSHSGPDTAGIGDARDRVEEAQAVYRETRDLLAEFILERSAQRETRRSPSIPGAPGATPSQQQSGSGESHAE
jgi:hypothetical protein